MRQLSKTLFMTLILATAGVQAGPQESGSVMPPAPAVDYPAQRGGMSLNEAVEQVRRQYNGRIVSAETRMNGNQEVHHIKVLTEDGKVKTVKVPGRTRDSR